MTEQEILEKLEELTECLQGVPLAYVAGIGGSFLASILFHFVDRVTPDQFEQIVTQTLDTIREKLLSYKEKE